MKIQLYYAPTACSLVPWVTLTEAKAPFETMLINMRKGQQSSSEYLTLNPKHKVPLLVIDGQPLSENVAIQMWIARQFPAARLLPEDPMQELQAVSDMAWFASGVHPHLSRINSPSKFAGEGADDAVKRLAWEQLQENFAIADKKLAGREFFFDHFTAVDAYFFWCFRRATQLKTPLSQFANCEALFARLQNRPSIAAVLAFEKKTMEAQAQG